MDNHFLMTALDPTPRPLDAICPTCHFKIYDVALFAWRSDILGQVGRWVKCDEQHTYPQTPNLSKFTPGYEITKFNRHAPTLFRSNANANTNVCLKQHRNGFSLFAVDRRRAFEQNKNTDCAYDVHQSCTLDPFLRRSVRFTRPSVRPSSRVSIVRSAVLR